MATNHAETLTAHNERIRTLTEWEGGDDQKLLRSIIDKSATEIRSEVSSISSYVLHSCTKLTTVDFPSATSIGDYAFYSCSSLSTADFPLVTSIGVYTFRGCSSLSTADFPLVTKIKNYAFYSCSKLATLILRSETAATLSNTNAFNSTPIASGTGYIYVPSALVNTYKAATNWSTYANQFRAIEDYTDVCGG